MSIERASLWSEQNGLEAQLWEAFHKERSASARRQLFDKYIPFARGIARRHFRDRGGDIELPDLCQLAYVGLIEAIDRFDPKFGAPFMRFAERRIVGSVLDGIVKTSEFREQISFRNRVRDERAKSISDNTTQGLDSNDPLQALIDAAVSLALGFMLEGTGIYMAAEPADGRPDAYESLAWKETILLILNCVSDLPEREAFVIRAHYLEGVGFQEIARTLDLTKGRISQMHQSGLSKLKQSLQDRQTFNRR